MSEAGRMRPEKQTGVRPYLGICPVEQAQAAGVVTVAKATLQHEAQSPKGFLQQSVSQLGMTVSLAFVGFQKGVCHIGCLQGLLREVACIVPTATVADLLSVVVAKEVMVAKAVNALNGIPAPLTEDEVE